MLGQASTMPKESLVDLQQLYLKLQGRVGRDDGCEQWKRQHIAGLLDSLHSRG